MTDLSDVFDIDKLPLSIRDGGQPIIQPDQNRSETLQSLRELAAFHLLYGQVENAEKFLRVAIWIDPDDGRTKRLLAHTFARLGQPIDAAKLMISAAKSSGVSLSIGDWKEVGLSLLKKNQISLGRQFLSKKK